MRQVSFTVAILFVGRTFGIMHPARLTKHYSVLFSAMYALCLVVLSPRDFPGTKKRPRGVCWVLLRGENVEPIPATAEMTQRVVLLLLCSQNSEVWGTVLLCRNLTQAW